MKLWLDRQTMRRCAMGAAAYHDALDNGEDANIAFVAASSMPVATAMLEHFLEYPDLARAANELVCIDHIWTLSMGKYGYPASEWTDEHDRIWKKDRDRAAARYDAIRMMVAYDDPCYEITNPQDDK